MEQREERAYFERILAKQDEVLREVSTLEGKLLAIDGRVSRLEGDVDEVDGKLEQSGQHELAKVLRERDELKDSRKHWLRYVVTVIVSLITGGLLLSLGRLLK